MESMPPGYGRCAGGRPRARRGANVVVMEGYDEGSYGRGMADVYDDWYADVSDVAATVSLDRCIRLSRYDRR